MGTVLTELLSMLRRAAAAARGHLGRTAWPLQTLATIAVVAVAVTYVVAPRGGDAHLLASGDRPILEDDAVGAPLFAVQDLAPGSVVTRCLRLRYAAGAPAGVLTSGSGGGAELDRHLLLTIEAGRGGSYDDCDAFTGRIIFSGTLDQFLRRYPGGTRSLPTWKARAGGDSRSLRFSLELADVDAAQGQRTSVAFAWAAAGGSEPTDRPTGSQVPAPAGAALQPPTADPPSPAVVATPAGAAGATTSVPAGRADGSRRGAAPRGAARARPGQPAGPDPRSAGGAQDGRDRARGRSPVAALIPIARTVAERTAIPLVLLALMAIFVLVQNRLDRRDPKLALAPLRPDAELVFGPCPPPRTGDHA